MYTREAASKTRAARPDVVLQPERARCCAATLHAVAAAVILACGAAAAPPPAGWRVQKDFFCHPYVEDARLHKNSTPGQPATMAQCQALCAADSSCRSFAFTNDNWEGTKQGLAWCFSPETDCPNPTGQCPGGCVNFDTFYNPAYHPPLFSLSETLTSHMVLQQKPARSQLWGWGVPGTTIMLQEAPSLRATVGADGRWLMPLPPLAVGPAVFGTGNLTLSAVVAKGAPTTRVVLTDVLVGEVWMCTGQSLQAPECCRAHDPTTTRADGPFS